MKITKLAKGISLKRPLEGGNEEQLTVVRQVLADVKTQGDVALRAYTERWDGYMPVSLRVTKKEIQEAINALDQQLYQDLAEAANNIRLYHEQQSRHGYRIELGDGSWLGQRVTALDAVGLYVPGGTAAYPSSVLMNVIPAQVAGVNRIVIASPAGRDGKIPAGVLVAAHLLGIDEIYKIGGAQAIAALAYGTETIAPVDKITGPGNIFVALAKREVFGEVAIDMIAGPSEIAVLADDTAFPDEIAADLLSQAEHDPLACAILVTTSEQLAKNVAEEVEKQLEILPRQEVARASIENFGVIYVAETVSDAVEAINSLAPEHLEIMTNNAEAIAEQIKHAGGIFIGRYSSEPVGDYFAGTNHVLPTNSTARFASGLNVDDFVKKSSIVYYSEKTWQDNAPKIARLARMEGLEGHARAVESRGWKKE
ncbi:MULTISPECIES: histidinol dehydrogenase [Lysinibacillus]|jgi:histidinol dehydrogenase|uniref:histidinol dehydrogenase n=1 Tax=Lysinibacillus TaxID=400634 RepID=UPI0004D5A892|nr:MULTISPECIES: histidinol dehydrogenase [Lysinibacillus]AJK86512.1 histidinol dehydrogenase [Lysinibacillus fusiformis]KGA84697.1 histidinol dehydrogenase [Lysinibacillus fusiformis]KHK51410.1 histidinol dehydrogenase [Lysinibacillus sp. A1]MCK1989321.1 histidinol dehydrogenase [Lysinibacillus fusiformis]MCT6929683.1 histidinol dehydrogenase [Lysinibacillus fusiformis]